jgi:hypothetical protein
LQVPHPSNTIFQVNLGALTRGDPPRPVSLAPGDSLLVQVWSDDPYIDQTKAGPFVEVAVKIVGRPVTPPSDHAYALLASASDKPGAARLGTRCVRFAWSPFPDRIELLDPDDLLRSAVRRRAVFRWLDVLVPDHKVTVAHSVQKITPAGSTHWPAD